MHMIGVSDSQIAWIEFHGRLAALWNMAWLGHACCPMRRQPWGMAQLNPAGSIVP